MQIIVNLTYEDVFLLADLKKYPHPPFYFSPLNIILISAFHCVACDLFVFLLETESSGGENKGRAPKRVNHRS